MKYYTAKLVIKEKGTNNKIKLGGKHFSQKAVDELQKLFVEETIYDPSHQVRQEMLEGLDAAKTQMSLWFIPILLISLILFLLWWSWFWGFPL